MSEEGAIERGEIPSRDRAHLLLDEGVAADRPLPVNNERAREDVRPFDGDPDRDRSVGRREDVPRTAADGRARLNVHRVVHDGAHAFGQVPLHDRRDDGRLLLRVDRAERELARGVHHVGLPPDPRERLFDPLEAPDRETELLPHARVVARGARRQLRCTDREGGEGDAAARGQAVHEHPPSFAGHRGAADDEIERREHVLSVGGTVLERHAERIVALPDPDSGQVRGKESARDSQILASSQQAIGIVEPKGETEDRGDRGERDVPLAPVKAHAEDLAPFVGSAADDSRALERRGVAARLGLGEGEARNLVSRSESRQIVTLLRVGPVPEEQLGGPERVGHHRGDGRRDAPAGELRDHRRMRRGRKAEAAELFRNDHAEEPLLLEELPRLRRQVASADHVPILDHRAELVDRTVEKRSLPLGQRLGAKIEQLPPPRAPREELCLPPDGARFKRDPLGLAHPGQGPRDHGHEPARHRSHPERRDGENQRHRDRAVNREQHDQREDQKSQRGHADDPR